MNIENILYKYKPIIFFHKEEKYFPCSADYFINNSYLIKNNKIIDKYMNQSKLYNIKYEHDTFIQQYNQNIIYGFSHNYNDAPLYYFLRYQPEINKLYIYFFLFFSYNGSYNILNISNVGEHYNDVEHFTYEINTKNGILERIFFSSHGSNEGVWKNSNEIEFEKYKDRERPILYCAKDGHGFYNKPGCIIRFFGFANDLTNKGFKYYDFNYIKIDKPEDRNFNPMLYGWFYSKIRMGFNGTKDIYKRNYLLEEEKGQSFQKIIPEIIYDIAPNITYLIFIIIISTCFEKYLNIKDRIKKTIYLIFIFVVFLSLFKIIKETINKI